ncbi:MAG: ATP-binding protein [Terriglobia bacterium]
MAKRKGGRRRAAPVPPPAIALQRTVPARPEATEGALQDVIVALRAVNRACGDHDEIRLALREALNNAVRHGSGLDPLKHIHVTCRFDPEEGLWLVVRDEGLGFDPETIPDPTTAENLERCSGRGLYMIRKLMDEVQFHDGGREIHMRRRPRR